MQKEYIFRNHTESIMKTKGKKNMHDKSHACHGQSHSKLHRVEVEKSQRIVYFTMAVYNFLEVNLISFSCIKLLVL